jgi:hypothetical protein
MSQRTHLIFGISALALLVGLIVTNELLARRSPGLRKKPRPVPVVEAVRPPDPPAVPNVTPAAEAPSAISEWRFGVPNGVGRTGGLDADPAGNVYVAYSLGGGNSADPKDLVVVKVDSAGQSIWSRRFPGQDLEAGPVRTRGDKAVVFSGSTGHSGKLQVDGQLVPARSMFLAMADEDGRVQWTRTFSNTPRADALALAPDGSIHVTAGFGPGPVKVGKDDVRCGRNQAGMFIAKLSGEGQAAWSRGFCGIGQGGGIGLVMPKSMAVDAGGNSYVTGSFSYDVNLGCGLLEGRGKSDAFIVKYDARGKCKWSLRLGDSEPQNAMAVALDGASNVYVAGGFGGHMSMGKVDIASQGGFDGFVLKLDGGGSFKWIKRWGAPGSDEFAVDLKALDDGRMAMIGVTSRDPQGGPIFTYLQDARATVTYVDADGRLDARPGLDGTAFASVLAVDRSRALWLGGWRSGTLPKGAGQSMGHYDALLARIALDSAPANDDGRGSPPRPAPPAAESLLGEVTSVSASSTMPDAQGFTFSVRQIIDGKPTTTWQPAPSPQGGVGQWIDFTFRSPRTVNGLSLWNGFQVHDGLGDEFILNSRLVKAVLQCAEGARRSMVVDPDLRGAQLIRFEPMTCSRLRVEVTEVRRGTRWADLAIGELIPFGPP